MSTTVFPELSWFQQCFSATQSPVPEDLQMSARTICSKYELSSPTAPMDVANAIAAETYRGDGHGNFYSVQHPAQPEPPELIAKRVVERLAEQLFEAPQKPCYLDVFEVFFKTLGYAVVSIDEEVPEDCFALGM